jgi:Flp pilus assembly protein TadG
MRLIRPRRRGAMTVLIALFLIVLIAMAAFSIDVAYMHLVRTQLRSATDAAAKAGMYALTTQQNEQAGINAAIAMAANNRVAGRTLKLTASQIELGQSQLQADGSWSFVAGAKPTRAMRINPTMDDTNANGAVNLFLGGLLGRQKFTPSDSSVASAYELEVVLVLDRSHSMCWDTSGTEWMYPPPLYSNAVLGMTSAPKNGSRWKELEEAVGTFTDVLTTLNTPPRVAVVTWSSEITNGSLEYYILGKTVPAAVLNQALTTTFSSVKSAVTAIGTKPVLGSTNMAAGIDEGVSVLTAANVRPYAEKVMILMTDGQWNTGRDPLDAAQDALDAGITIHTIGFLEGQSDVLVDIAELTGGKTYTATDGASLQAAFRELALTLPIVITK